MTHGYNIKTIKTANTWRFELQSTRTGVVLLWYSVPHNLLEKGKETFLMKVRNYYQSKRSKPKRTYTKKADKLLAEVETVRQNLAVDLQLQANSDFLADIVRVNIS